MKKIVVFLFFILFNVLNINSVEATEPTSDLIFNQDGLEVTVDTDKGEYKKDENIVLNLTVKNKNNFSVNNIAINSLIPDTLKLKEDIPDILIDKLKPNEVYSLSNPISIESELLESDSNKSSIGIKQENSLKNKFNPINLNNNLLEKNSKPLIHTKNETLSGLNTLDNKINEYSELNDNLNKSDSSLKKISSSNSTSKEAATGIDNNKKVKEESNKKVKEESKKNNKNKNEISKGAVIFSAIVIAGGVIFLVYNKKTRKVAIILLAVSTPLSQTGILTVEASEKERNSFDVHTEVSIDNTKYDVGFKIEYDKPKESVQEELDSSISIQVNEAPTDEVIKITEENATITGVVNSKDTITAVIATYYSNVDKVVKKINVEGLSNWSINEIPLEIGTNFITLTAYTSNGNYNQKEVLVNRLSTTLELADNVIPIDPKDEQGLQKIKDISDSILESWVSDNGTIGDTSDDSLNLLVGNDNPILKDMHDDKIKEGDIIYIPANEYFLNGLSLSYESHDDIGNTYGYSPDDTEVIHAYQSSIADLIEGEISISADSIDYSDPVDYIIAPENSTVKIGNQSVTIPSEDTNARVSNNRTMSQSNSSENKLNTVFKPQITLQNDNDNLDISIKIEDQILFDQDNDSDTENDQISFNGEIKYSNYDVDFGIERNTILGLPEQIKAQTSHTYNKNFSLDSPELSLSGEEVVKKLVDKYSITDAKLQFGNFSLMGLELDKTIVLGAVGLNLATGIVTTQNGVFSNPLDINAVVLLLLDMNGEMKVSVTIQEEQSSYIEQGINVQKNGFEGSYGTIEENKGTNNKQNGDYWFQTTNIEAKSSAEKDQSPSSKKTLSLDGEGSLGVQASGGLGVTLLGTLPVALRAGIGTRLNGSFQGTVSLSDKNVVDHTGNGSLKVDVYAEERFDAALSIKNNNKEIGIAATIGPFEQEIWSESFEFGETSENFKGSVYTTDLDQNIANNQAISNAKISLEPYDAFSEGIYEVKTNEQGEFIFESLPLGKYKLIIEHDDHKRYVLEEFDHQGDIEEKYYLDKESHPITLEGKITIADADLNSENNTPLTNVDVVLQKKFASNNIKATVQTNENGEYKFSDLTPGIYELTMNKEGFLETKGMVVVGITGLTEVSNYMMEAISDEDAGIGTANGEITDAFTGETALGDFKLSFREGYNYENAQPVKEIETNSAEYNIELPAGIYTVYATPLSSNGIKYQADTFFVKVLGNKIIENQNGKITPILEKDQIRVVLTWGEAPRDLDSHLTAELDSNEQFQISYRNTDERINDNSYYKLDVDDTSSFGPETTTLSSPVDGKYTFSVFNYTNQNQQELKNSGAMVKVYFAEQVNPFIFYVPNLDGNAWDVFEYNVTTDTFKVLNKVYTTSSSAVGPIVNYQNNRRSSNSVEITKDKEEKVNIIDEEKIESDSIKENESKSENNDE